MIRRVLRISSTKIFVPMPQVVREDIDNLNAVLTVTIDKASYESKFKQQLGKYQQQAHMKGFRKGKTPLSVIKKMYGKSVLADIINEELQKELFDYIRSENLPILGQPLPSDQQEEIEFNLRELSDYIFKFDVGLAPDFELQGFDENSSYEKYKVSIPEDTITEELETARKRLGERVNSEEQIQEDDLVRFEARELDGSDIKEGGVESEFSVLVSNFSEAAKQTVFPTKIGEEVDFDITQLEEKTDADYARKYFLKLEADDEREVGNMFRLKIAEATHIEPAELNEDFFKQAFNSEEITTEEQARAEIRKNIERYYEQQAEALLYRDVQEALLDKNEMDLPDAFLKRWILASNEQATEEDVEKEYDSFTKNLQWTLIRDKIVELAEIEITQEEIAEAFKSRVRGYFQGNPTGVDEGMVEMMTQRLMQDEKQFNQVRDEVLSDKLLDAIMERVTIVDKPIEVDEFGKVIAEAQEEAAAEEEE